MVKKWLGLFLLLRCSFLLAVGVFPEEDFFLAAPFKKQGVVAGIDQPITFYVNPASLSVLSGMQVDWLRWSSELGIDLLTTILKDSALLKNFSESNLNLLLGRKLYGRTQLATTFAIPSFAFGVFVDQQLAFYSQNKTFPEFVLGYQTSIAIQGAYSYVIWGRRRRAWRRHRRSMRPEWSVGIGGKWVSRRGGYRVLTLSDVISIPQQGQSALKNLFGTFHSGFGLDLGTHLFLPLAPRQQMSFGLSFLNIGDISFGDKTTPQKSSLSFGTRWNYQGDWFDFSASYDFRSILSHVDWKRKHVFGTELALPVLRLFAGWYQTNLMYGFSTDVWLLEISALRYKQNIGPYAQQSTSDRVLFEIRLKTVL